MATKYFFAVL